MGEAIKKIANQVIGKIADGLSAEMIEPITKVIINLISLLDLDSQPEIKIKLAYIRARDHETKEKERWLGILFRRVEQE